MNDWAPQRQSPIEKPLISCDCQCAEDQIPGLWDPLPEAISFSRLIFHHCRPPIIASINLVFFHLHAFAYDIPFSAKAFPHLLLPNQILPPKAQLKSFLPLLRLPQAQMISNHSELIPHHWLGPSCGAVHWVIFHLTAWPQEREWMTKYRLLLLILLV